MTAAADAICPRNCFSGTTFLPLKELRQFSTAWARSSVRRAVILTESNSTPRKEILCTGESLLFPQLTRSPNWLSRIVRVRQAGQREPRLQTLCKRLQRHNRRTCGGAAKGSRGGWHRRRCVLRHPHRQL